MFVHLLSKYISRMTEKEKSVPREFDEFGIEIGANEEEPVSAVPHHIIWHILGQKHCILWISVRKSMIQVDLVPVPQRKLRLILSVASSPF